MTDIPVIFSAPMIKALLAGRKTMTRRLLYSVRKVRDGRVNAKMMATHRPPDPMTLPIDRYYDLSNWQRVSPGDRLWVRENFRICSVGPGSTRGVVYLADTPGQSRGGRNQPSIHMPRWASRLTLTITATKIERLKDISGEDAIAEGIPLADHKCGCEICAQTTELCPATASSLVMAFADLWRSLHGADSWAANPAVVALSFKTEQRNIDDRAR